MNTGKYSASHLPRVYGFNLFPDGEVKPNQPKGSRYNEWDFDFMAEHGFRFARLPRDYRNWTADLDGRRRSFRDDVIEGIVEAVEMGKRRGIHVCVNMHRGPGFCVIMPEPEPYNLWTDAEAQETFAIHWEHLARAVKNYSNDECSLNLINEPPNYGSNGFSPEVHRKVMGLAAAAIRKVSPDRLIICDGANTATAPAPELKDLGVAQSTRGYTPYQFTQYKAEWWPKETVWPEPEWPVRADPKSTWPTPYDKTRMRDELYRPWVELARQGVGVHCGEMGVYKHTPAKLAYAYIEDVLSLFDEFGWGWAFWTLRGTFGIFDNERAGTVTETYRGHQLDRALFELIKQHMM